MTMPSDPLALLRSRSYVALLVLAAIIGAPVSAVAYFFLALVSKMQGWVFTDLPKGLGFHAEPLWWPLLPLAVAGVLVSPHPPVPARDGRPLPRRRVQGGRRAAGPIELPGIVLAAFATLCLGVVLGPEAPLIASAGGSVSSPSGWPSGTPRPAPRPWSRRRAASPPSPPCSAPR